MSVGDLALLYNSRVKGKPKKLHIEWMGPYIVEEIHTNGLVRLRMLQGIVFRKLVNGAYKAVQKLNQLKKNDHNG